MRDFENTKQNFITSLEEISADLLIFDASGKVCSGDGTTPCMFINTLRVIRVIRVIFSYVLIPPGRCDVSLNRTHISLITYQYNSYTYTYTHN